MKRTLKFWGIGVVISLIAVASTVLGVHTPFEVVGFVLGLPMFIVTAEITKGRESNLDYALMIFLGSLFYGAISYLISLVVRRVRRPKT